MQLFTCFASKWAETAAITPTATTTHITHIRMVWICFFTLVKGKINVLKALVSCVVCGSIKWWREQHDILLSSGWERYWGCSSVTLSHPLHQSSRRSVYIYAHLTISACKQTESQVLIVLLLKLVKHLPKTDVISSKLDTRWPTINQTSTRHSSSKIYAELTRPLLYPYQGEI